MPNDKGIDESDLLQRSDCAHLESLNEIHLDEISLVISLFRVTLLARWLRCGEIRRKTNTEESTWKTQLRQVAMMRVGQILPTDSCLALLPKGDVPIL
jgi:hypothetical protein